MVKEIPKRRRNRTIPELVARQDRRGATDYRGEIRFASKLSKEYPDNRGLTSIITRQLMAPPPAAKKRPIGFVTGEEKK